MAGSVVAGLVIVGGSHAATQLAHGLRRFGWLGKITIVGEEPVLPYHRPPLSKDYLKGKKNFEQILIRQLSMYEAAEIDLMLGRRAISIDRQRKSVSLDDGQALAYDILVLTTGARPRQLPVRGTNLSGVNYVRTISDIDKMLAAVSPGGRAVVIGGGYIGLEAAASLRILQMNVTVLEAQQRILQRVTCPLMSEFFTRLHREEGVTIRVGENISSIQGNGHVSGVEFADGHVEPATLVVIGIGIQPNVELAEEAGLAVDNGIVVNEVGQTQDPNIYAAGDCASFVHPRYRQFIRLESVQHANDQAMTVAKAICGTAEPYDAVPWFWSDQFDVKLQIAGLSAGCDAIVQRGDPTSGRSFSLCYVRGGKLLAVDAVNRPKDFVMGKKMILDDVRVDPDRLRDGDAPMNTATLS
jgi:3-phenylpropionate/trans-cinnamate dioxygenase ferredoxin reductase component